MKRSLSLLLFLAFLPSLPSLPSAWADCPQQWAVVRIPSHGASATVIATGQGVTWLLGCGHAYEGKDRNTQHKLDVPWPNPGQPKASRAVLVAVDYQADLSLVRLDDGPVPYCCPVAPQGHKPSRNILSAGYDEMKLPMTCKIATIVAFGRQTTWTAQRPWLGRSGGALIDADAGVLIGVVQGYELEGQRRGMYVSHQTILAFLAKHAAGNQPPPRQPNALNRARPPSPCPS